jgi:hypothetical protein
MVLGEVLAHTPVLLDDLFDTRKRALLGQALGNVKHDIRVEQLSEALYSPAFHNSVERRTISTFSCDIA